MSEFANYSTDENAHICSYSCHKSCHTAEKLSLLAFCGGNHWSLANSPHTKKLSCPNWNVRVSTHPADTFAKLEKSLTAKSMHCSDIMMSTRTSSEITDVSMVCSIGLFRRKKYQSSALLAFVRGIHRWPVNSPHKGPVTQKMFLFDDVIMERSISKPHLQP